MKKRSKRRRHKGEGTVFKHRGSWIARVIINGKRVERRADSKPEAEAIRNRLVEDAAQPLLSQHHTTSIGELLENWIESTVRRNRAKSTYENYRGTTRNHIAPYIGNWYLRNLSASYISDWLAVLQDTGIGARTRQNAYAILHACVEVAVKQGVMRSNPVSLVDRPSYEREPIDPFTIAEMRDIIQHVADDRLCAAYHLAFRLGLRGGELWGLQWADVNFDDHTLSITRQACEVAGNVHIKKPKSKAGIRTLDIDSECVEHLRDRQAHSMREGLRGCEWIFPNQVGNTMRRSNFGNRHWSPVLKALGIRHRGFHHVRHTAATMMLKARHPLGTVSAIIGHSKASTTLDIYGHFVPRDGQQAVRSISDAINPQTG